MVFTLASHFTRGLDGFPVSRPHFMSCSLPFGPAPHVLHLCLYLFGFSLFCSHTLLPFTYCTHLCLYAAYSTYPPCAVKEFDDSALSLCLCVVSIHTWGLWELATHTRAVMQGHVYDVTTGKNVAFLFFLIIQAPPSVKVPTQSVMNPLETNHFQTQLDMSSR